MDLPIRDAANRLRKSLHSCDAVDNLTLVNYRSSKHTTFTCDRLNLLTEHDLT